MALREDFKDDVLDTSVNTNRTFNILSKTGTVLQTDVRIEETTAFEQEGDDFGATELNAITAAINAMFDIVHPVGELYITTDASFNPNTATGWHGTWERDKGRFVRLAGDNDTIGSTGGADERTLTTSNLPSHAHTMSHTHSLNNHTHYVEAQSGSTSAGTTGEHNHTLRNYRPTGANRGLVDNGAYGNDVAVLQNTGSTRDGYTQTLGGGGHSHAVTINAHYTNSASGNTGAASSSNTGTKGEGTAFDNRPFHENYYGWRRTA